MKKERSAISVPIVFCLFAMLPASAYADHEGAMFGGICVIFGGVFFFVCMFLLPLVGGGSLTRRLQIFLLYLGVAIPILFVFATEAWLLSQDLILDCAGFVLTPLIAAAVTATRFGIGKKYIDESKKLFPSDPGR